VSGAVPEIRYATAADGVTLAYQVLGDGPPVVWLPSLSNLVAQWRVPWLEDAYRHLARHVTLVLYDGRGTGSSDRRIDTADLGVDAHVRDLTAVLDAAGLRSASLFGWYHSVATAVRLAATRPERVTRLLLFGGAARMRDAMSPAQTQALLSLVEQDWDLFADTAAATWLGWNAGPSGRLVADLFRTSATPATAHAWFTAAASLDVTDDLARVTAPAVVLHRQGERQIPVEVSRRLADGLPRGRLVELAGDSPTLFHEDVAGDLALVTSYLVSGVVPAVRPAAAPGGLTPREHDVLRLLAAGHSNPEIARELGIAVHTVERHAANLYRKIGARGRSDAVAYAYRHGLA
jgi:DNA-binding CsgD family transcriptional regulator/pimeloyl-ACP methyl ester carboxylesterase